MSRNTCRAALARRLLAVLLLFALGGVGCAGRMLSVEDEQEIGRKIGAELIREPRVIKDPLIRNYIEDLGERILDAAGPQPFEFTFYVLDAPEINAFATPGGHVVVHTGLILAAENMSELAGVMGHEIGHVALRHIARSYYRNQTTGLLAGLLGGVAQAAAGAAGGSLAGWAAGNATQIAAMAYVNSYSRDYERESDHFAVQVLPRAGIHPIGLATFFETMMSESGGSPPAWLSSHPAHEERIENARRAIAVYDIGGDLDIEDDGRLEIIQRRIELLTGR
ncbi:MAG: M48 family metallopeptidase [Myxococcota bacterium]